MGEHKKEVAVEVEVGEVKAPTVETNAAVDPRNVPHEPVIIILED